MSETPRGIFEALLSDHLETGEAVSNGDTDGQRADWLARFDAASSPTARGSRALHAFDLWKQGERLRAALAVVDDAAGTLALIDLIREWAGDDFAGEFDALRVALRAAHLRLDGGQRERADGWISVEERLPRDASPVLVLHESGRQPAGQRGVGVDGLMDIDSDALNLFAEFGGDDPGRITHWRPLPEPPR